MLNDVFLIGPVALPVLLPLFLGSAVLGALLARQVRGGESAAAMRALWQVLASFLLVARLAHVWEFRSAYLASPIACLDFTDGGWNLPVGMVAAWLLALVRTRSGQAPVRPVLAGTAAASAVLTLGLLAMAWHSIGVSRLPALTLEGTDGQPVLLQPGAGRPLALNLWASWCPSCLREMPALVQAQAERPDVDFVFVDQGEGRERVTAFLAREGLGSAHVLLDPRRRLAAALGIEALPVTLFFDAQGRLRSSHIGAMSASQIRQRLLVLQAPAP